MQLGTTMLCTAANLGRDRIIDALLDLGAVDVESVFIRATPQSDIGTAGSCTRPRAARSCRGTAAMDRQKR